MNRLLSFALLCLTVGVTTAPAGTLLSQQSSESFSLKLSSSTLALSPNQGGTVMVSVVAHCRTLVSFAATGFPSGITYSFLPATSDRGTTLTVFAPANTPTGNYPITIVGRANRNTQVTSLTLTISAPNFSVEAPDDTLTLQRGTSATLPITVDPGPGFTGAVTFGLTGLPAGVTYTFTPTTSKIGSTLVIKASPFAPIGTFAVALTGASGGALVSVPGTLIVIQ